MATVLPLHASIIKFIGTFLDAPQMLCRISKKEAKIWDLMREGCYEQMTRRSLALQPYVRYIRAMRDGELTPYGIYRLVHTRLAKECRFLRIERSGLSCSLLRQDVETVNLWNFFHKCMKSCGLARYKLDATFKLFRDVTLLDIKEDRSPLTQLPSLITEFVHLRALRVTGHRLWTLPPEMKDLKELRVLHVVRCSLAFLPDEIGELSQLKTLILRENNLRSLPLSICQLKHLEKLDVSSNPIAHMPEEIARMPSLKQLITGKKQ